MVTIFYKIFKRLIVLSALCILVACGEQQASLETAAEKEVNIEVKSESEPVDEAFTLELQTSLDKQLSEFTEKQTDNAEQGQNAALERLTELDRETLIDETAEQGSEQIKEDADKIVKILEDIAADNE